MIAIVNQFSFLTFSLLVGAVLIVIAWRWRRPHPIIRIGIVAAFALVVVMVGTTRRYPATPEVTSLSEVDAILNNDQPTFVMLYSNYCIGCMAALPDVRSLAGQLSGEDIDTLLINIHDEIGQTLTEQFEFTFSPTYLVFASDGREVLRANSLPRLDNIRLALSFDGSTS
jgi:thiol-disulfide isomerase/thioredoxin